jgi:hypothetical protein
MTVLRKDCAILSSIPTRPYDKILRGSRKTSHEFEEVATRNDRPMLHALSIMTFSGLNACVSVSRGMSAHLSAAIADRKQPGAQPRVGTRGLVLRIAKTLAPLLWRACKECLRVGCLGSALRWPPRAALGVGQGIMHGEILGPALLQQSENEARHVLVLSGTLML